MQFLMTINFYMYLQQTLVIAYAVASDVFSIKLTHELTIILIQLQLKRIQRCLVF